MSRSYRMLCPITRALDRVGDRWTLLILRDLHAGPMRFNQLKSGLPGLASNLLTTRLEKGVADGLLERDGPSYQLTELGRKTDQLLWELAMLGMAFPAAEDVKRPGHLRLLAVTLQNALRRVDLGDRDLTVELVVDGEPFTVAVTPSNASVTYGAPDDRQVLATSSYEPLMAAAAGEMPLDAFRANHVSLEGDPVAMLAFRDLMTRVMVDGFRSP